MIVSAKLGSICLNTVLKKITLKKFVTINEHQVILKSHLACYWPKPIKKQQFQIIANFLLEILNLWSRE